MNRDIEFRGLAGSVKGDIWVYGTPYKVESLFSADERYYIRNKHADERIVDPKTIGQYTGLKDKNGKKIFERDIVIAHGTKFIIKFGSYRTQLFEKEYGSAIHTKQFGWYAESIENKTQCNLVVPNDIEVIGNIYENKELLEV